MSDTYELINIDYLLVSARWNSENTFEYETQDDASISWRKRKKHFFILSNSGKPIYSRFSHFFVFIHQLEKLLVYSF